jgi:hypothetical protein
LVLWILFVFDNSLRLHHYLQSLPHLKYQGNCPSLIRPTWSAARLESPDQGLPRLGGAVHRVPRALQAPENGFDCSWEAKKKISV